MISSMSSAFIMIVAGVAGIALVTAFFSLFLSLKLQGLRKQFFAGKNAAGLEEFIINQNKKINDLTKQAEYIEKELKNLKEQQKFSVQKIGLQRYNPFSDDGGNLSFSMALLDDHDNGVVITSMHGRDQNRIYAKPIKQGKSDFQLTAEENTAIKQSKNL